MVELLARIAHCVERGKISTLSPFPKDMLGSAGVTELVAEALAGSIPPQDILRKGLIAGMETVGERFRLNKIFIPEVMISAKAMNSGMQVLLPCFEGNEITLKGTIIVATVQGDLHDIGKNIVGMFLKGAGWNVVDLGVNVSPEVIVSNARNYRAAAVCLSALLTTTMLNMEQAVMDLHKELPQIKVLVGGAPLSHLFAERIGADFFSTSPQEAIIYLDENSMSKTV